MAEQDNTRLGNVLTPEEYQARNIDFYAPFSIEVQQAPEPDEEKEEVEPLRPNILTPVGERDDATPNIFRQVPIQGGGTAYDISDVDPNDYIANFGKDRTTYTTDAGGFKEYLSRGAQAIKERNLEVPGVVSLTGLPIGALAYGAAELNRAQQKKNATAISEAGGRAGSMFTLNGQTVSRAPGSTRFDGTIVGMSNEQLYRLDEIRRGFVPGTMTETFDADPLRKGYTRTGKEALSSSGDVMIDAFGTVHGAGGPQMVGAFQAERAREQMFRDAMSQAGVSLAGVNVSRDALAMKQALDRQMGGKKSFFTTTARMSDDDYNAALSDSQEFIRNYIAENHAKTEPEKPAAEISDEVIVPDAATQAQTSPSSSDDGDDDGPSGGTQYSMEDIARETEEAYADSGGDDYSWDFNMGGRVGMQEGGVAQQPQPAGFVGGPPENFTDGQTIADDQPMSVPEGTFVINAAAVEFAGSDDIKKMLSDAYGKMQKKVDKTISVAKIPTEDEIDVAVSRGEVIVPPAVAKIIGYDRLEKINNRGKKEVSRRQEAAGGGFLDGKKFADGGDVGEDIPMDESIALDASTRQKFNTFLKSRKQRGDVEKLIDKLDDRERLFVLGLVETTAAKDSVDSMMGVMQTAINRANTDRPSFKAVNDLPSVMKQRSARGSGSRMFQYDGLEPSKIAPRLREVVQGRVPSAVTKLFMAAENVTNPETEGQRPLPFDVMFYTKPDAPLAKDFEKNPKMRYYSSFGGHDYYALDAAPEK